MNCPYCNTEMIHGYLNCGTALWSERKHTISLLTDSKEKCALNIGATLLFHHIESDCCPNCKKIIIDSSAYKSNLK